jgi:DNA-binding NarL/FixJ family response regulator
MKVLLADDSDLILERLTDMISTLKEVEIVACLKNGTEVMEAVKLFHPDLAIIDIKMPGLNGLEVLNEIRKDNKTIKIIILTLFPSDYYRELATLAGADYFFSKVDDFEKLSTTLSGIIRKSKLDSSFKMKMY